MFKSKFDLRMVGLLALVVALAIPSIAFAGGWAVITLDQLPEQVVAGQPYTLGLMARQHGWTPLQMNELRISARQADSGQQVSFTARPEGQPGHYQAELLFPEPGRWEWSISSGLYPEMQPMPALVVADAAAAAAPVKDGNPSWQTLVASPPAAMMGGLALLALAAGLVLIVRGRQRRLQMLAGAGMLVLCAGLVFGLVTTANAEARQAQASMESANEPSLGQQLFLAKGCVVCHVNDRALGKSAAFGVSSGPNLTDYRNDPEFLHSWLKDPQSMRPNNDMPNLELKKVEIEALIEFINDQP